VGYPFFVMLGSRTGDTVKRTLMMILMVLGSAIPSAAGRPAAAIEVVGIRYWTAPDHTRIVIDLSRPSTYTFRTLTGPHRIVIEVPGTVFANKARRIEIGDGFIDRIRTNALRSGTAQVVVDLPEEPIYKTFALKKVKGKKDRIVIDVLRKVSEADEAAARKRVTDLKRKNKAIVVIDPGHGGEDPGAVASGKIYEKDIVLKVCREMAKRLEKDPRFEIFLTRKGDYSVSLARRQRIARDMEADMFISVHANAAPTSKAHGAEVFFLSMKGASDAAAKALAESENEAHLVGGGSGDARGDIDAILFDLNREDALRKSSALAELIHDELQRSNLTRIRKVKQARFAVLKTIEMPAVLVELGFLSNATDRRNLCKSSHRRSLAAALAGAIERYFDRFPPGGSMMHVVARGENLWRIARAHGVTVQDLKRLNDLGDSDRILAGQKLRVQ